MQSMHQPEKLVILFPRIGSSLFIPLQAGRQLACSATKSLCILHLGNEAISQAHDDMWHVWDIAVTSKMLNFYLQREVQELQKIDKLLSCALC